MKPKTKYMLHAAAMLFLILHKINNLTKLHIFRTSAAVHQLSVASTPRIRPSSMLLSLIMGN
jgi:hypothetical protein